MIIVDTELRRREEAGRPVRVGLVGAGSIARANAIQIVNSTPGMVLSAISNRTVERAIGIWRDLGAEDVAEAVLFAVTRPSHVRVPSLQIEPE